jgi:hypothetical protein
MFLLCGMPALFLKSLLCITKHFSVWDFAVCKISTILVNFLSAVAITESIIAVGCRYSQRQPRTISWQAGENCSEPDAPAGYRAVRFA